MLLPFLRVVHVLIQMFRMGVKVFQHSYLCNRKLYFFITFHFFGPKVQHYSTFGSNQDDRGD